MTNSEEQSPATTPAATANDTKAVATKEPTIADKFIGMVTRELESVNKGAELSQFQQRLARNYFIKIDSTLKDLETKRLKKSEQYREPLAYNWNNLNLQKLSLDVVSYSSVGLDPLQPNHLNFIPYKNNATNKYDVGFIIGYRGIELKTKKYGLDVPDEIVVELVYKNDKFRQIKKDKDNEVETYSFEVVDDFNRGECVGGFYYHRYNDDPKKNKIRVMTMRDILKRKPKYASVEFWGGTKKKYNSDETIEVEGWADEMYYKTVYRKAYNDVTIDSAKIDEQYTQMLQHEQDFREAEVQTAVDENANKTEIGLTEDAEIVDETTEQATPVPTPTPSCPETKVEPVNNVESTGNETVEQGKVPF